MRTSDVTAVAAGLVLLLVGGSLMTLAWNGAASLDSLPGQFPYLLSGSVPGLALIVVGVTVLVVFALHRAAAERSAELQRLHAAIRDLAAVVTPAGDRDPLLTGEYRPRPRAGSRARDAVAEPVGAGPAPAPRGSARALR